VSTPRRWIDWWMAVWMEGSCDEGRGDPALSAPRHVQGPLEIPAREAFSREVSGVSCWGAKGCFCVITRSRCAPAEVDVIERDL